MAGSSNGWPVHELSRPSEGNQTTELNVLFFHGLQLTENCTGDAWSSTWTQRHNVFWPQDWLSPDLGPRARIFSVSYNAHAVSSPHGHVSEIAVNLFQNLTDSRYDWCQPIVLIGHGFGGLVLKSLVVEMKRASTRKTTDSFYESSVQRAMAFSRNVKGVVFYAVPHAGSSNIAKYAKKVFGRDKRLSGIMDNVDQWKRDMESLSVEFDEFVRENKIAIYAFGEGMETDRMGILVEFSSAQRSAGRNSYKVEDADHMEVCKPPSREHSSYGLLLQFIRHVAREYYKALQDVPDLPPIWTGGVWPLNS